MNESQMVFLASLISAGVITPDEYVRWSDEQILKSSGADEWIIDLSLTRDSKKAVQIIRSKVCDDFNPNVNVFVTGHAELCASYLSYKSKKYTWEYFLQFAIKLSCEKNTGWIPNDFKRLLDSYIKCDKDSRLEENQAKYFYDAFEEDIEEVSLLCDEFKI